MRIVALGLSLSSSWGNGHATTYRALFKGLAARGHEILFLERDRPWYAAHRDLTNPGYCDLRFYNSLDELNAWQRQMIDADAVIVGSYVPEGTAAGAFVQRNAAGVTAFYDIDTPVTLRKLSSGDEEYLSPGLIPGYDLYLSFTGGPTLRRLESQYRAHAARALYCSVDPDLYSPVDVPCQWDLGYIGTYSADRQPALEQLVLEPARRRPDLRFVVAGAQYPDDIAWPGNVDRIDHLSPVEHARFYSSLGWTLNITRADMIAAGWSPSVRLFEAAACLTPIVSDWWSGLDQFFHPGSEICIVSSTEQLLAALASPAARRQALAGRARQHVLAAHTAAKRATELEAYLLRAQRRASRAA
ncbi:MAG: glycosyltransferase [Acetobacteraceae bacterium]|nr:glycosyltransferase [Acetobacteraceae bacterium]MBV8523815.1 glycosyltransferase [Acetobacteraceae bacterium]